MKTYDPFPPESKFLTEDLSEIGLFSSVQNAGDGSTKADVIAEVTHYVRGTDVIPVVFILTLGIIPEWHKEKYGFAFRFYRSGDPVDAMEIDYREATYTVMGWAATPLGILPGWNWLISPASERRYYDRMKCEILKHSEVLVKWEKEANLAPRE
ncbi:hypothetical protein HY256_06785 [Candidatus Sumerlaeota bacterium]|nr:hypothetical protein [Candidatus Sumerlaeota bacterium]